MQKANGFGKAATDKIPPHQESRVLGPLGANGVLPINCSEQPNQIIDRDERWTFGHALHVEDPTIGTFIRNTLYSKITLNPTESNWVLASVPTPNVTKGWKVGAVALRYTIRGGVGVIDKIGLRDGDQTAYSFEGLALGPISDWQSVGLSLPPSNFQYGLGVSIHVNYPVIQPLGPTEFLFASVGLGFVLESP